MLRCRDCRSPVTSTDPWTVVWGGPMRLVPLRYCSPCRAERAIRRSPSFVRHLLALSGVSAVLLAGEPTRAFGWLSVNILLFQLITFAVLIPVHEIGHAIAGRLVGLDVVAVVIGHGRTVWSGRLAGVPLDARAFADARTAFLSVLEQVEEPQARAMLQNNVAFTDFMMDAGEWRDEADALSAAAIAAFPKASSVLGTRGSVLVWLGRAKEGIPLLERSFAQHETSRDRATNACALAMGYHASGDTRAAARWLAIARRLDGRCLLLDRTTAAIADREGGARAAS